MELELSSVFGKQPGGQWDGEGHREDEEEEGKEAAGPESSREPGALEGPCGGSVLDTALLALGALQMSPSSCIGATLIIQAVRVSGLGGRWLDSGLDLKVLLIAFVMERNHKEVKETEGGGCAVRRWESGCVAEVRGLGQPITNAPWFYSTSPQQIFADVTRRISILAAFLWRHCLLRSSMA